MSATFHAEPDPADGLLECAAALAPANPFHAAAYFRAKCTQGPRGWLLCLREGDRLASACPVFVRSGRWSRAAEIESLPTLCRDPFWEGLLGFCRREGIARLEVGSYASQPVAIPALNGVASRAARCEHVLPLEGVDLWGRLVTNHRRCVQRARKAGVGLECVTDPNHCADLGRLVAQSLARRKARGEPVPDPGGTEEAEALLRCGAGVLFQAVRGGEVLSAAVVLLARRGAYYHSSGTSPEGMACGASALLLHEAGKELQTRGLAVFNLGGATADSPGLYGFKKGFGAEPVPLEAAELELGSPLWKRCRGALRRLRDGLAGLFRRPGAHERQLIGVNRDG